MAKEVVQLGRKTMKSKPPPKKKQMPVPFFTEVQGGVGEGQGLRQASKKSKKENAAKEEEKMKEEHSMNAALEEYSTTVHHL